MNNQQKQQAQALRYSGMTYAQIAELLGLSLNTVKSFCRRKGIGVCAVAAVRGTRGGSGMSMAPGGNDGAGGASGAEPSLLCFCPECGQQIECKPKVKPRRFCSDYCRYTWWNKHRDKMQKRAIYYQTCQLCGKDFESYGNQQRKYCSHGCYIGARYGKAND